MRLVRGQVGIRAPFVKPINQKLGYAPEEFVGALRRNRNSLQRAKVQPDRFNRLVGPNQGFCQRSEALQIGSGEVFVQSTSRNMPGKLRREPMALGVNELQPIHDLGRASQSVWNAQLIHGGLRFAGAGNTRSRPRGPTSPPARSRHHKVRKRTVMAEVYASVRSRVGNRANE